MSKLPSFITISNHVFLVNPLPIEELSDIGIDNTDCAWDINILPFYWDSVYDRVLTPNHYTKKSIRNNITSRGIIEMLNPLDSNNNFVEDPFSLDEFGIHTTKGLYLMEKFT